MQVNDYESTKAGVVLCNQCSHVEELFFIVDTVVEFVEIADEVLLSEGVVGLLVGTVGLSEFLVEAFPLLVISLAVLLVLLHCILLLLVGVHAEGLLEGERVDLLQDCLQGN
jgi:hypothetical protein